MVQNTDAACQGKSIQGGQLHEQDSLVVCRVGPWLDTAEPHAQLGGLVWIQPDISSMASTDSTFPFQRYGITSIHFGRQVEIVLCRILPFGDPGSRLDIVCLHHPAPLKPSLRPTHMRCYTISNMELERRGSEGQRCGGCRCAVVVRTRQSIRYEPC